MPHPAIIFGAGNIGRGFIAQLFTESGYEVTFVDVDPLLVNTLNQQQRYTIRLVTNTSSQDVTIAPVRGVLAQNQAAVVQTMAQACLAATAVGARALEQVAATVAAGVMRRADEDNRTPLNFIICENLKNAAHIFAQMVKTALPSTYHAYLAQYIGFVDTVIARMIPPPSPDQRAANPGLIVAEPYKTLPVAATGFIGPIPDIVGMIPAAQFSFYTDCKLYIHNAGHAVLGYLGYQKGYTYGYEALLNPQIRVTVQGAMTESRQALEKKYHRSPGELTPFVDDLLSRFENKALGDTTFRLGRDPLRKLAPNDRLIGAARTVLAQNITPTHLIQGIVAALYFDAPDDPLAVELQQQQQRVGLKTVLTQHCGVDPTEPLGQLILAQSRV